MNIKTKKIIAREFLYGILFLLLGVGLYYSTYPYNYYLKNKKNVKATEINKLKSHRDSLESTFKEKKSTQEWFYKQVMTEYDVYNVNRVDVLWNRFMEISDNDSIEIKWKGKWKEDDITLFFESIGFYSPDSLDNFIRRYSYSKSELSAIQKVENIDREIKLLKNDLNSIRFLSNNDKIVFVRKSLFILLFLLFILRYAYYGTKWSIKTLKN